MRAIAWLGLWRGLLVALWPSLLTRATDSRPVTQPWQHAAQRRRLALVTMVLLLGEVAALLGPAAGIPIGWPLLLVVLLFAWVGAGLVTACMGAWVLWRGDTFALPPPERTPIGRQARTAIIMPICNEEIATVFGGLRATCESLAASGALPLFDIFVLSDTPDPVLRAAEMQAWSELRASLGDTPASPGGRVFYRYRRHRTARKAGNVADFCRRWGADYRYMVVLDADSVMHGDTLVAMVRLMEQHPRAGILQTLPQPLGRDTLHGRAQQFAARVSGRVFALGMAYWQLGESHYWGHNAILRMEPFMAHCRMAQLPGRGGLSGHILSHDFVEAALMRRAGYEVWLLPELGGSWEQTPPNLLDELQRDRRWCQGNLQNARLIAEPGWKPAHRAMFATGALSYLVAPLWLALLASGAVAALAEQASMTAVMVLAAMTVTMLLLPRLLGVAAIFLRKEQGSLGGGMRVLAGTLLETVLSALQAPVRMLAHTIFVVSALTGLRLEWRSPPRQTQSVAWRDSITRIGLTTLPVLALALWLLPGARHGAWTLLPVLLPLALAVPMVVFSGHGGMGALAGRFGILSIAEDRQTPRALSRARSTLAFAALQPPAQAAVQQAAKPARNATWGGAWAAAAVAALAIMVVPRSAIIPDYSLFGGAAPVAAWPQYDGPPPVMVAVADTPVRATTRRTRLSTPSRPARFIDDAVRERARRAVAYAMAVNQRGRESFRGSAVVRPSPR